MLSIGARSATRSRLRRVGDHEALAPLYRIYRRAKVRYLVRRFHTRVVQHQFGHCRLSVSLEDPLAENWYDHDWPQLPELTQLSSSRLKRGARVFDLGAHQGVVAMMLAHAAGDAGTVVAVEAERHNYEVAVRNRALNYVGNLELLHAAVAAEEGSIEFAEGLNGRVMPSGSGGGSRVSTVTVDTLAELYGSPDVVYVDVEGYEQEALRGATRCIGAGDTDFLIEVHVDHGLEEFGGTAASVLASFPSDGFRRLVRLATADPACRGFSELDPTADPLPRQRFFLLAIARGESAER